MHLLSFRAISPSIARILLLFIISLHRGLPTLPLLHQRRSPPVKHGVNHHEPIERDPGFPLLSPPLLLLQGSVPPRLQGGGRQRRKTVEEVAPQRRFVVAGCRPQRGGANHQRHVALVVLGLAGRWRRSTRRKNGEQCGRWAVRHLGTWAM